MATITLVPNSSTIDLKLIVVGLLIVPLDDGVAVLIGFTVGFESGETVGLPVGCLVGSVVGIGLFVG